MFWKIYCLRQEKTPQEPQICIFMNHINTQTSSETLNCLSCDFFNLKKYLLKMDLAIILETK